MVIGDAHERFGGNDPATPENVFAKLALFIGHKFPDEYIVDPPPADVEYAYKSIFPEMRAGLELQCVGTNGQGSWLPLSNLSEAKRKLRAEVRKDLNWLKMYYALGFV